MDGTDGVTARRSDVDRLEGEYFTVVRSFALGT